MIVQFVRAPYVLHRRQRDAMIRRIRSLENQRDRLQDQLNAKESDSLAQVRCIKNVLGKCLEKCMKVRKDEWRPSPKEAFQWRAEVVRFLREAMISSKYAEDLCEPFDKLRQLKAPDDVGQFFRLCRIQLNRVYEQVRSEDIADDVSVEKWNDWEP